MKIRACHSHAAYTPETVVSIIKSAKRELCHMEFDSFAFSGFSGALVAPVLAMNLNKTMIHVRKESDLRNSHAYRLLEGDFDAKKYIIIDDFIGSGNTVDYIISTINKKWADCVNYWASADETTRRKSTDNYEAPPVCIGIALYQGSGLERNSVALPATGYRPKINLPVFKLY